MIGKPLVVVAHTNSQRRAGLPRVQQPLIGTKDATNGAGLHLALLLTLILASMLGIVASSIYIPSLPAIASTFGISAGTVQLSFVSFLTAFAGGMLVLGPLSDRYGRRRMLLLGLGLTVIGSAICACSPSIELFIAARAFQGLGASAASVVVRAIVRDRYGPERAAQVIAWIAFGITLVQALTPALGALLQLWIGWRANFIAVMAFALTALVLASRIVPKDRTPAGVRTQESRIWSGYGDLIVSRKYLAYAAIASGAHAGFHIFCAGAPIALMETYGISPQAYGSYAILPPIGFLLGSSMAGSLKLSITRALSMGSAVLLAGCALMLGLTMVGIPSPLAMVVPMMIICCGSGLITPNAIAASLNLRPNAAGTASGLTAFLQLATAAGMTAVLSYMDTRSPMAIAGIISAIATTGILGFLVLKTERRLCALLWLGKAMAFFCPRRLGLRRDLTQQERV